MVLREGAVFGCLAAFDHRCGDVASVWQETLTDDAPVAVDVALAARKFVV
jgi:hypothetical protein